LQIIAELQLHFQNQLIKASGESSLMFTNAMRKVVVLPSRQTKATSDATFQLLKQWTAQISPTP